MSVKWSHFLPRLIFAFFIAYISLALFLSLIYTWYLVHPGCPAGEEPPSGFEAVALPLPNGKLLKGWWYPPENGVVVLLLAGHGGNRDSMLPEAEMLVRHGFGAMTLDYRQCVDEIATLGVREVEELQQMVDFARSQTGVEKLVALGFSVGGATVIRGAAGIPEIEALVAEGNYANLYEEIITESNPLSFQWLVQHFVLLWFRILTGVDPDKISPVDDLEQIQPRPVLLIHGEQEITRTQGQRQYEAAGPCGQLWVVPGAGHGAYYQVFPQEYETRIVHFFQESVETKLCK